MSLTDGAVAELARQAADELGPDVAVRIRPPSNDDPYRWGGHGWLIQIGDAAEVWIPAEASDDDARALLLEAVRGGTTDSGD